MTSRFLTLLAFLTLSSLKMRAQGDFDTYFLEKSLRVDFYHAGNAEEEMYYLDEVIEEPYWAGSKHYLVDERNMGVQQFRVLDKATGKVIYSRGYNTLFNEWQTTPEARRTSKAMPEGLVFPYPKNDVTLEIYSRQLTTGLFVKKYSYDIDMDSYFIRRATPNRETIDIHYTGKPSKRVDIVVLPEGYAATEKEAFIKACHDFKTSLFAYAPYSENEDKFNIRAVWVPSEESGVSMPGEHQWRNTALDVRYYTFDSERYQMTEDYQRLLDLAANVPYETIYILSNSQKYGGGGIYNFYGISAANIPGAATRKTYSHEFGHLFAGLADEYVEEGNTMSELYPLTVEPWEPNVTTLVDFASKEWKQLLGDAPVPTPTKESREQLNPKRTKSLVYDPKKPWQLGVYEGGGYVETGVYRPWPNCMMNWFHTIDIYCPVCRRAIQNTIDLFTK